MTVAARVRTMLPPEARVIGSRLRPSNRAERIAVQEALILPPSLHRSGRRRGSVWGLAMMRNEADTVRHVIEHMFAQDVDVVLVADNASTDETGDVLSSLAEALPIHVVRDDLLAYAQATKMTLLAGIARRSGADWIVPFDADELWFAIGRSVGSMLRASDAAVVSAQINNVFPGSDDDPHEDDPFLRLRHVDTEPSPFRKVAFRAHRLAKVTMGNLDVMTRGARTDGLFIAHYPWRSFEQMAGKLRHGRTAMMATTMPEAIGVHWRVGGAWSDKRLAVVWDDLLAGRAVDELSWSPIGELQPASPGTWRTWPGRWPIRGARDDGTTEGLGEA